MMGMSIKVEVITGRDFQFTYLSQNKAADDFGLLFNRLTHRPFFLNLLNVSFKNPWKLGDGTINYTNGTRALRDGDGFYGSYFGSNNSFFIYISQMIYVVILFGMVYYIYKRRKEYITSCFLFPNYYF